MNDLLDLERAGWDALCDGTGSEFYGAHMTDAGLMVLADGSVFDRDAVVASLADAPPWDSYRLDDVRTVPIGPDTAALVYRGTGTRGDTTFVGVMTSVYVRTDRGWRLALYQQTPSTAG